MLVKLSETELIRRYLFWISYDGGKFRGGAKSSSGFGATDFLENIINYSLPKETANSVKLHISSRLIFFFRSKFSSNSFRFKA